MSPANWITRARVGPKALLAAAVLAFAVAQPCVAAADPTVDGEILLRLTTAGALDPLLAKHGLSLVARFGARPIFRLKAAPGADVQRTIDALLLDPNVLDAEPNTVHSAPEARRNLPWAIGEPTAYAAQWAPEALRLAEAQKLSVGAGVRVAVLDTGVDAQHPALLGRVLPGFDFVDNDTDPSEVGTRADVAFGHGTHVAGLVALVAPGALIVPYRVLEPSGRGNAWVLADAVLRAVDPDGNPATDDGAQVLNLSLGGLDRTRILDSITKLATCTFQDPEIGGEAFADPGYNDDRERCNVTKGAVVVAAAGNSASDSEKQYPAAEGAYGLLPVAATAADGRLASFSNFGSWIALAAPGDGITSSVPGGKFGTWSGTSMAAPFASGTVALLRAQRPMLSAKQSVRQVERYSRAICGASQRQIDAAAVLERTEPAATACP